MFLNILIGDKREEFTIGLDYFFQLLGPDKILGAKYVFRIQFCIKITTLKKLLLSKKLILTSYSCHNCIKAMTEVLFINTYKNSLGCCQYHKKLCPNPSLAFLYLTTRWLWSSFQFYASMYSITALQAPLIRILDPV